MDVRKAMLRSTLLLEDRSRLAHELSVQYSWELRLGMLCPYLVGVLHIRPRWLQYEAVVAQIRARIILARPFLVKSWGATIVDVMDIMM